MMIPNLALVFRISIWGICECEASLPRCSQTEKPVKTDADLNSNSAKLSVCGDKSLKGAVGEKFLKFLLINCIMVDS